jgi:hypothetical protein
MVEELYEVIPRVQEPQEMEKGICWQIKWRRHELAFSLYVNTESRRGKSPRILNFSNIWKCEESLTLKLLASAK